MGDEGPGRRPLEEDEGPGRRPPKDAGACPPRPPDGEAVRVEGELGPTGTSRPGEGGAPRGGGPSGVGEREAEQERIGLEAPGREEARHASCGRGLAEASTGGAAGQQLVGEATARASRSGEVEPVPGPRWSLMAHWAPRGF